MHYPKQLLSLIEALKKLPGVGKKTAERYAFKILDWTPEEIKKFSLILQMLPTSISLCDECGCFIEQKHCVFCSKDSLHPQLCIVAYPKDVYPIAQAHLFKGYYHVLGGLLSPLEGKSADQLRVKNLIERIQQREIREVILALDATLNGDATALFLAKELSSEKLKITKLASGLPLGSSLDYIDEGTLSQAFQRRHDLNASAIQTEF